MATTMKRIALIGLGMMGRPMGHCLHAGGCTLVVGDADPAVEQAFIDAHPGTERYGARAGDLFRPFLIWGVSDFLCVRRFSSWPSFSGPA